MKKATVGTAPEQGSRPNSAVVRILDVARRAGVSPATVSRVLNNAPTVNEQYRARVLVAIAELEYRPNLLARRLRRQQADTLGVLVSDIENPHFTEMVRALEDAAYQLGYRVLLCNTDENPEKQRAYLEVLAAERVLGVVLTPSDPHGHEVTELLDLHIPVVAFDRLVDDPRADSVVADNFGAGQQATAYLLQEGHTRIGFIGDPNLTTGVARIAGYEDAMQAAALQTCVVSGWSRIEGGAVATDQLIRELAPSALVIGNNLMAIGVLRALRAQGIQVPEQMAVVAIDDPFWAEIVEPPLTVLAQPVRRMAACVIDLLLERLRGERTESRHVVFQCELIERQSGR